MHNQNFSQQITATAFLALGCNEKRKKNPVLKISLLFKEQLLNFL